MFVKCLMVVMLLLLLLIGVVFVKVDELVDEYNVYIGCDDFYNFNGECLCELWQIIWQDCVNYYKFGICQCGDELDFFFVLVDNCVKVECMICDGIIICEV